jgi:subtilisin family serine protease
LDENQVASNLARAFMGGGALNTDEFTSNPTNLWERDTNSHGTAVASHVIGFKIGSSVVDGVAPDAIVIPLKVFPNGQAFTFASRITAAIAYVADLKESGVIDPVVINMSLGGGSPSFLERAAIDDAIAKGVIVVASAGNSGEGGMGWPGAFPEVISAGAVGWTQQRQVVGNSFWWQLDVDNDLDGTGTSEEVQSYVAAFSSRAIPARSVPFEVEAQELDVLAPGRFTVAPCILPFAGAGAGTPTFCFWSGTSFSSPLTAGVAALMVGKQPSLTQADVERIMKANALPMSGNDGRTGVLEFSGALSNPSWDTDCNGLACDAVGAGLLQADAALAAVVP